MNYSIPLTRPFVLQLEEELLAAMKASDVQALDQLLHDDLLFIIPNGQTITKQMDLDSHRAKQVVVEQLTPHYEQVSLINDCAVVTLTLETKGVMLNERIEGSYRYIRVWKMSGGRCRVIAGSCTAV
ncbi:MAG: nuclear transport factor 2 family protein [Bacteroidota bacterium]